VSQFEHIEGLRELDKTLEEFSLKESKGIVKRALVDAGKITAKKAAENAPKDDGDLARSYVSSARLTRKQSRYARKANAKKTFVETYVGTNRPQGVLQEFGTINHKAQPHLRPAWESTKRQVLNSIAGKLTKHIEKKRKQLARKAARLKVKG
jgi:HK97 gp10 family phage protein